MPQNTGFNQSTLLVFVFGLVLPACVLAFFFISKQRKKIAFESIGYGFGGFLISIAAVLIAALIMNGLFMAGLTFEDETSGLTVAGAIISFMVAILGVVCEFLKILTIRKFQKSEKRTLYSGIGYSAGVVIAQSLIVFIAMNIMQGYDVDSSWSLVSGGIVLVTGIMYLIMSASCDIILAETPKSGPAFIISMLYYAFWIAEIFASRSTALLYTVAVLFFVLSAVLCGVFIVRTRRSKAPEVKE